MNIQVSTLYNVGDKVWVYRYITENISNHHNWHYGIEEREISLIRVLYNGNKYIIQYFLKGLQSYEGENWFDEDSPSIDENFDRDGLFQTKEEAEIYFNHFNKETE